MPGLIFRQASKIESCARQLISRSVSGSVIESMWLVCPARLKRKSCPSKQAGKLRRCRTSAITISSFFSTPARLRRLPPCCGKRLSTMVTLAPSRRSARARFEPMKPRPPVMRTFFPPKVWRCCEAALMRQAGWRATARTARPPAPCGRRAPCGRGPNTNVRKPSWRRTWLPPVRDTSAHRSPAPRRLRRVQMAEQSPGAAAGVEPG